MAGRTEMRVGVPVRRVIATPDMTTGQAQPQVHPVRADPEAILATLGAGCDIADFFQVWVAHGITFFARAWL